MLCGAVVSGKNLEDIVATAVELPHFFISPVGNQCFQFRGVKEMLTDIRTVFRLESLVFTIAQIHHALFENPLGVTLEEGVPMGAPN